MTESLKIYCGVKKIELMRVLALRTALVRMKVKPAEIFFVRHCYRAPSPTGTLEICASQREVLEKLGLPWYVLRTREEKSLVLFYDREALKSILTDEAKWRFLAEFGYTNRTVEGTLAWLRRRFEKCDFPHEIGLLLGYPLKDVVGFTRGQAAPSYYGAWRVYGDVEESLKIMDLFRRGALEAERILTQPESWETCIQQIGALKMASV